MPVAFHCIDSLVCQKVRAASIIFPGGGRVCVVTVAVRCVVVRDLCIQRKEARNAITALRRLSSMASEVPVAAQRRGQHVTAFGSLIFLGLFPVFQRTRRCGQWTSRLQEWSIVVTVVEHMFVGRQDPSRQGQGCLHEALLANLTAEPVQSTKLSPQHILGSKLI